jgi:hypothetical protein
MQWKLQGLRLKLPMGPAEWTAVAIAIGGWVWVAIKLIFGGGTRLATIESDIAGLKEDVKRIERKTDDTGRDVGNLVLSVGRLEGAVSRINGRGGHQ